MRLREVFLMGDSNTLVEIRRLLEATTITYYAGAASASVTSAAFVTFTITGAGVAGGSTIPDYSTTLVSLNWDLTAPVGMSASGTAAITWYLSRDSSGDSAITNTVSSVIQFRANNNANPGSTVSLIGIPYQKYDGIGTANTLYAQVRVDAGSCTLRPYLTYIAKYPAPLGV